MTTITDKLKSKLSGKTAIIWDLDNTLYRLDRILEDAFNSAFARIAVASGAPVTEAEAAILARQSFMDHGFSGRVFIERYGVTLEDLHYGFHNHIDVALIERQADICDMIAALPLNHALITHASRRWALNVLDHIGLTSFFPSERVFGLEDYKFRHKHECASSFTMALEKLGSTAANAIMVEDTARNLKIPHNMGLTTILIHHGQPPADMPGYIDGAFSNAAELLTAIQKSS